MVEKELIEKVIELRIRPVLQAHGGDIEFQDYQDDIVWVNLTHRSITFSFPGPPKVRK